MSDTQVQKFPFNDRSQGIFLDGYVDRDGLPVGDTAAYLMRARMYGRPARDWTKEMIAELVSRHSSAEIAEVLGSRIPPYGYGQMNLAEVRTWFEELASRGFLFHPEDEPKFVLSDETGKEMFRGYESYELKAILGHMTAQFGLDKVCHVSQLVAHEKGLGWADSTAIIPKRPWDNLSDYQIAYVSESGTKYTKADFISMCYGDKISARELFCICEWQHPETLLDEDGGYDGFAQNVHSASHGESEVNFARAILHEQSSGRIVEVHMSPSILLWSEDASALSESFRSFGDKVFGAHSKFAVLLCPTHDKTFSDRDQAVSIEVAALLGKETAQIKANFPLDLPDQVIRVTFGEIFETPVGDVTRSQLSAAHETAEQSAAREQYRQAEMHMKQSGIPDDVLDKKLAEQEERIAAKEFGGKDYRPATRMKG